MLNELKVDDLLGHVDSRYGLVLAGARRARQINEYTATLGLNDSLGIPGPQVHTRSQHPLSIAFEELRQGKIEVGFRQPPEEADAEAATPTAAGDDFINPAPVASPTLGDEDGTPDDDDTPNGDGEGAA